MHGKNKLRPVEKYTGRLQVHEIWYTMQGEGPFYGRPAIFIRLTGCNLACDFCDTVWDDENDLYVSVKDIARNVTNVDANCKLIVITGGEPLRQDLTELIGYLCDDLGYEVQIETAGTYWQDCLLNPLVTVVCSPKTKHVHPGIKKHCIHWKYVMQYGYVSMFDGLPAGSTQFVPLSAVKNFVTPKTFDAAPPEAREFLTRATANAKYGAPCRPPDGVTVWLSPCDEGNEEATSRNVKLVGVLCMKYGYRAQVQMHKILGLP